MSPLKRRPLKTIEFFENHKIVPFPARKAVNSHEVHGLGLVLLAIHKFLASDVESGVLENNSSACISVLSLFLPYQIAVIWKPELFTLTLFGIS